MRRCRRWVGGERGGGGWWEGGVTHRHKLGVTWRLATTTTRRKLYWQLQHEKSSATGKRRGVFLRRMQAPALPPCLLFASIICLFYFLTGWQEVPVLEEEMEKGLVQLPLCGADVTPPPKFWRTPAVPARRVYFRDAEATRRQPIPRGKPWRLHPLMLNAKPHMSSLR